MREIMRSLLSANLTVTGILMFIGSIIVFSGSVYLIKSYRGFGHARGKPIHGQRT